MFQLKSWKTVSALSLVIFVIFCASSTYAQGPAMSPLNPPDTSEVPSNMGFIPPRVDLSHLTSGKSLPNMATQVLPTRWDWRTEGVVTSVKNQSSCGSCYAFMSTAAMESRVALDGGGTFDFSENNAKECYYSDPSCNGGNFEMVANVFSQNGTVLETCDPYVASNVSCETGCSYSKALLGWNIVSSNSVPATSVIQNLLYTEGPFYTSIYAGSGGNAWQTEFGSYDGSYVLYNTATTTPNHAALIVGWDDTIPHVGGTGAWIVKNSWGTSWGGTCDYGAEGGYYYIAYGSASFGQYTSYVNEWQDVSTSDNLLFYDEAGWTNQLGYTGFNYIWGMVKFTLVEDAYINRVEFWTTDSPADVDIYIYDDFSGGSLSNLLASELGTTINLAGYHSVQLSSPPQILTGNDIYIAIKFTNNSYDRPLVIDVLGPNETAKTYYSLNGSSWSDMGTGYGNDVAIRARTSPTLSVSVDDEEIQLPFGFELKSNYPNPFNPTTTIEYTIPTKSHVDISIFNLLGQKVKTVVDDEKSIGEHNVNWDGTNISGKRVASGIYLYRIVAGDNIQTKKMMLIK